MQELNVIKKDNEAKDVEESLADCAKNLAVSDDKKGGSGSGNGKGGEAMDLS